MPEPSTVEEHVRAIIADELELFDVLVVTDDTTALRLHHEAGSMPAARLIVVDDPAAPLTQADKLVLEFARAGKALRTWCSLTEDGRRIARETAQTLDPHLPAGSRVLHITDPPPHAWQPQVDSFQDLVKGARARLPSAARKATQRDRSLGGTGQFNTDPESIARRIILNFGSELLIAAPPAYDRKGFSTGYALDEHGVWSAAGDIWALWLVKISSRMRFEALHAGLEEKAVVPTLAAISRIKTPKMIEPVQQMLDAALRKLREEGERCPDVTTCRAEELNANMRYLGAANGVVDLHTGKLIEPEQARNHLVTIRCPVEYHQGATHPALEMLFASWPPTLADWWKGVLGFSLRAIPKRLYFAVGPPDSGKSTIGTALSKVLGPYMRTAAPDVLQKRNRSSETQLTPGLRAWHRPTRIVWINEIKESAINERLTMDLAGGGDRLAARGLHEDLVEEDVTATTFATCNPESIPHLKLTASGMRARYRELRYPKAKTLDPHLKPTLCNDPDAQRALLSWLVAAAVASPVEPDDVPEIRTATNERIRADGGEIGEFARRIVRSDGVLSVAQVWNEWCSHNGEKDDAKEPGGIGKRRLSTALSDHVANLGRPKQISTEGRNVRGWRGWRLLSPAEVASADANRQAEKSGTIPFIELWISGGAERLVTNVSKDQTWSHEEKQAARDLRTHFPGDFSIFGHIIGAEQWLDMLKTLSGLEVTTVRGVCKDGRELAEALHRRVAKKTPFLNLLDGQVFDAEGYLKETHPELDDEGRAKVYLHRTVHELAWVTRHGETEQPKLEEVRDWRSDVEWNMGFIALGGVEAAVRMLGPKASADDMEKKAVKIVMDYLDSAADEHREKFESAIERLVGARDAPYGILERLKENRRPVVVLGDEA
jgi:phage/plasmid-associated DNA primase